MSNHLPVFATPLSEQWLQTAVSAHISKKCFPFSTICLQSYQQIPPCLCHKELTLITIL